MTAEWLAFPKDQYLCSADMAHQFYCTVGCQEGNDEVSCTHRNPTRSVTLPDPLPYPLQRHRVGAAPPLRLLFGVIIIVVAAVAAGAVGRQRDRVVL